MSMHNPLFFFLLGRNPNGSCPTGQDTTKRRSTCSWILPQGCEAQRGKDGLLVEATTALKI